MKARELFSLIMLMGSLTGSILAKDNGLLKNNNLSLTIEDYVKLVLSQSERAKTAYNNFENATYGYKVVFRQLNLPQMSVDSSVSRTHTDLNSVVNEADTASGFVSLEQPLYLTGGNLTASYSRTASKSDSLGIETDRWNQPVYEFSLNQPLYIFSGNTTWRSWKNANISYQVAKDAYKREIQSIENTARAQYYDVLFKKEQLEVENVKQESSRRSYNITQALVNAGRYAEIERYRSEVKLKRDQRRVINAESALEQSINSAKELASIKLDAQMKFISQLSYAPLAVALDRLIEFALTHRPDYLSAQRSVELSELSLRQTLEANNPFINARASLTHSESGGTGLSDSLTKSWSGGVNLSWLFFDSRITHLQAKAARNDLENSRIAFKELERNIRTEVTNAFVDLKTMEEQMADLKESRNQARRSVDVVRMRYKNGIDRLIDVFDSENELRDIELEYLNLIISANTAKDQLAFLAGGSWDEVAR